MPHGRITWLAGTMLAVALGAGQAGAREAAEMPAIGSFSGALLAARVAEVDNDLASAAAYYEQALSFDPDNQGLQQSLLLTLVGQGRFEEALPYAEKLKTVPEVERFSRLTLAVEAFRQKDFKAAENWLKLALSSDLDRLITETMTAWSLQARGDGDRAIAVVDKLQGPEWYALFKSYHTALIAEAAGLTDEAASAYADTVDNVSAGSAAPDTWLRAAQGYATFLYRQGRKAEALEVLDRAEEFASGRLPIADLRRRIEGGETVPPMIGSPAQGAAEVLVNLAGALNRGGGEPFVRLYLQLALALQPDNDTALLLLASMAEQGEDAEEAIERYRRVPASSPVKRLAELQLGLNLADLDRHEEAIEHLTALLDAQPDDMRAYLALGGVHASKEDYRSAAAVYDRAVKRLKKPTAADWNIFYQRGIAYERLKEWSKAEPNFKKALELQPEQPQVMNYLGYSWVDMNMNLEQGLELIRRAVDLRPSDGYIVDSLGWAYYRLGRYEEAVTELERAVSLRPDDPVLNDHLGDAYWRVGRKLEATFQWSHARDMKPDPAVLASVEKKLREGLPDEPGKAAAENMPAPAAPTVE